MAKIIAPVVTIFNEEEKPDYAGNKKVIDFLIEGGLDGILVLGSAGEFPDLNEQERLDFFRFYAEYVNGRVELLAGTGCIRYADTLALSNAVYELGYTPMVISPYYFEMDQEKLFVYYDRLAKDVKGDLYLYNFPPRTGHSIAPETIRRLIDANPNIIGLKDSVSIPGHTTCGSAWNAPPRTGPPGLPSGLSWGRTTGATALVAGWPGLWTWQSSGRELSGTRSPWKS